jgi:2'-5' RNA ligase
VRLFVAVDVDDRTRALMAGARDAIQSVLSTAGVAPRVTWVKEEAAHVTLRFIGEISEDTLDPIKRALGKRHHIAPFDIEWDHVGTFPAGRHPRVIWIGPSANVGAMTALAADINSRLEPIVGAGESRPFNAHITLGRVKDPGRSVDWPRALAAVRWTPTVTRVDHVTLYSSRTSPKGAIYTALATVRLG